MMTRHKLTAELTTSIFIYQLAGAILIYQLTGAILIYKRTGAILIYKRTGAILIYQRSIGRLTQEISCDEVILIPIIQIIFPGLQTGLI